MARNPTRPDMFTCATQVSVIQVGVDEVDVKDQLKYINPGLSKSYRAALRGDEETVPHAVLKRVSTGFNFTEEVVRDMAPYTLPYNEKSIYDAYDTSEFLSRVEKKTSQPIGRFNMIGADKRHLSCHFKKTAPHKLKPIKRAIMQRALELQKEEEARLKAKEDAKPCDQSDVKGVFLTETSEDPNSTSRTTQGRPVPTARAAIQGSSQNRENATTVAAAKSKAKSSEEKHKWDEYLLSVVSKPTAQWIVTQRTDPNDKRYKVLYDFVVSKYGVPSSTELVRDDMKDYDDKNEPLPQIPASNKKVRPNTQSARLLQKVHDVEDSELDTVPYADQNIASFYRQPGGIKKIIKVRQREMVNEKKSDEDETGALNTTATSIAVKKQELPPPPKLQDFVNPRITENTVFETNNNFQRDWLTGNKQVHQTFGDDSEIVMENHNKYSKVLQDVYPRDVSQWCPDNKNPSEMPSDRAQPTVRKQMHGHQRWADLPKPVEDWYQIISDDVDTCEAADADDMVVGVLNDIEQSTEDPTKKKFEPSEALSRIVDEWRAKWHLNMRFDDSTPEDLIKDMEDIHPHVRIKAVSTCARAVLYKPPPVHGIIQLTSSSQSDKAVLPEKVYMALECLLDDEHSKVRLASAVTLHALQRPSDKAEQVLREHLEKDQNKADRWAAVQCLGLFGYADSDVIGECVDQMLNNEDMILYEKACTLLAHMSNNTRLVHSMLGEHLNDCSWRHRVMALKCLPKLYGGLNIDLQNKLVHIMWNDAHSDVRKAAAQSLGKCGYARLVHDRMRQALIDGTQTERAETLSKIGFLGIMTAKLMVPFMKSFRDEYVAVRKEACIAAGNLGITDDNLIAELLRLANRDPIWRIKALAFQALGKIGVSTPEVNAALLWALRFEEEEGVRAEACHSILLLQLKHKEVIDILQNRMLVETSSVVQRELAMALEFNGVSATEDMAMVAQIKAEVRKLSNRTDIYKSICQLEAEEQLQDNKDRLIYVPRTSRSQHQEEQVVQEGWLEEDQLVIDKTTDDNNIRPLSKSHKTHTTETIPEVDEEEDEVEQQQEEPLKAVPARIQSAKDSSVASRKSSARSRPESGVQSSLKTDEEDEELGKLGDEVNTEVNYSEEYQESQSSCERRTESRRTSGIEKKRVSESRAVSVTPTVLSVSLDQTQAIHSNSPSVRDRLKSMATAQEPLSMSPSLTGRASTQQEHYKRMSMGVDTTAIANEQFRASQSPSMEEVKRSSEVFVRGQKFTKNLSSLDAVDMTRFECTNYLYDRYSFIDIETPKTLSPLASVQEGDN